MDGRTLSNRQTGLLIFVIGALAGLTGDACHVASGTTEYLWDGVPTIWRSAIWFPVLVGGAVLGAALAGRRAGLPARTRDRRDAGIGIAAVIAMYSLTAALRFEDMTVSVVLFSALAAAIWFCWDPSPGALAIALGAAILGPVAEILIVQLGASQYTAPSDGLFGVAPWLPCLYFAAGSVASGLWSALQR